MKENKHLLGMALAGGGARGAYSAGVLRYLYTELPKRLGYIPWPKMVCGTSVGALNGYFAATHSLDEIKRMKEIWTKVHPGDIYDLPSTGAFSTIRHLMKSSKSGSLLSNSPLRKLINTEAERRTLRHSINARKCLAFIVSATQLTTGINTLFVETADPTFHVPPPPRGRVIYSKIYPHHLMASIAIPMVFQPERVDGDLYVDGGVRQNTPLQPVLQSGADRIIVLSTRAEKPHVSDTEVQPSLTLVAGKTLNALTLDPVERDALVTKKINKIIGWGVEKYGPDFEKDIFNELNLRKTEIFEIRPSMDLGRLSLEVYNPKKVVATKGSKWLMNKIHEQGKASGESDLLSQLLFDEVFTVEAERLGFKDAMNREEELIAFLSA